MKLYEEINKHNCELIHELSLKLESSTITNKEKETLFKLVYNHIYWLSYRYHTNNKNYYFDVHRDIDDFAQDIMLKILNAQHRWRSERGRFTTWYHAITFNLYVCKFESKYIQTCLLSLSELGLDAGYGLNRSITRGIYTISKNQDFIEIKNPESIITQRDYDKGKTELLDLICNDPDSTNMFKDRYFSKLKIKDISKKTGLNTNTIKTKLRKVRLILQEKYKLQYSSLNQ